MITPINSLQSALRNLPENAPEAIINDNFSTVLLQALGFEAGEIVPQYETGSGKVDKAARKTSIDDIFLHTRANPYLILELKGREVNLAEGKPQYSATVNQLKKYLLSPNCKSVQWGIITNSSHIQLFRKHGKVVFPATQCLEINLDNINDTVASIRKKIEGTNKALTVTIYNNKGGVGKTTTTVNLAGILTLLGKKVLLIDFDLNQQDLTKALGISISKGEVKKALVDKNVELTSVVSSRTYSSKKLQRSFTFDVIPADSELENESTKSDDALQALIPLRTLYRKLNLARQEYDYILIDASPNWRFISQLAVYAADVILMPAKHNNLFSLENTATAIKKFIPEIQNFKKDGTPIALPIFFNGETITEPQREIAQKEINKIIDTARKEQERFNLLPYFYPRHTSARRDLHIHEVPSYASIAGAAFSRVPAVYRDIKVREYYKSLAKEYFIQ